MNSFPVSSKKIVVICLLVIVAILLGVAFWVVAVKMQAKDALKYMSDKGLVAVIEVHNTDHTRPQWQTFTEKFKKETAGASLLGVSEEEASALIASLPEQSYLLVYETDSIFIFNDNNTLTQKKLSEALKKNFTVLMQDGFVIAGNGSLDSVKAHIFSKESDSKKIADSVSRSAFDSSAVISFNTPASVSLHLLGDKLVPQVNEAAYKVFIRDILSSMSRPNGNIYVTSEGYLNISGKIQMPKDELQYFVQRSKLDMTVFSSIPSTVSTIFAFVAEPGLTDSLVQYFKEQKTESIALSWQYLIEAILQQYKIIDQPKEMMAQLEKGSVGIGITSSGNVVTSLAGLNNGNIEKITELLKGSVEKNLAYEEITTTLPDKTKAVMLERHPEKVSVEDKSASGGLLKEIIFNEKIQVKIASDDKNYTVANFDYNSAPDKTQYDILQKYFKEPSQWFIKSGTSVSIGQVPYLSDLFRSEKMTGTHYTSVTTYTDGITYRILFVPNL